MTADTRTVRRLPDGRIHISGVTGAGTPYAVEEDVILDPRVIGDDPVIRDIIRRTLPPVRRETDDAA